MAKNKKKRQCAARKCRQKSKQTAEIVNKKVNTQLKLSTTYKYTAVIEIRKVNKQLKL